MKQHPDSTPKSQPPPKRFHSDLSSSLSKETNPNSTIKVLKAKKIIRKLKQIKKCKKYLTESENSSDSEVSTSQYHQNQPYVLRLKAQGQFMEPDERGTVR